ncbi:MAG: glycoside hydrolase family 28 protein [Pedobacter sp.]|nr:MAG: glycoside hydrolase family 28 protein [Pedobacter sp.]
MFTASLIANAQKGTKQPFSWSNLPVIAKTSFKADTFNIVKFGAKNDGFSLNTKAINDAIVACNKNGGGVVVVPKGMWITGPIELKSNVNLHLQKNSILQFTRDFDQYPLVASNWEGLDQMRNQSPLWATNQTNIAITGFGIVDGAGDAWRMVKKSKLNESQWAALVESGGVLSDDKKTWYPSEQSLKASKLKNPGEITSDKTPEFYKFIKDFLRPNLLVFTSCKKILLEGVTFQNSPAWNIHPLMCEDLTVRNVYAKNPWYAQNGDGIDLESCKNVLIEGSTFDVGDDGICIKSGRDAAGRKRGMPTENVIIRNSTVYHAHGGFVIGSEMSGGAKNIFVSDCSFIGTDIGLRFKTTRGRGGIVENIFVKNINMTGIVGEAILFDMYYAAVDPIALKGYKRDAPKVELLPVNIETPVFRDFHITDVVCDGAAKAVFIRGLPEMSISNITLDNLNIKAKEGIDIQEAKNIKLTNVNLITKDTNPLINVQNGNVIEFKNINYNSAQLLFRISGDRNSGIKTSGLDVSKATKKTEFLAGAEEKSLQINK